MPKATSRSEEKRQEAQSYQSSTPHTTMPSIQRSRAAASPTSSPLPSHNSRMVRVLAPSTTSSSYLDTVLQRPGIRPAHVAIPVKAPIPQYPLSPAFRDLPSTTADASFRPEDMQVPLAIPRQNNQERREAVVRSGASPTQVDESTEFPYQPVSQAAAAVSGQTSSTIKNNKMISGGDMSIYTAGRDITIYKDTSGLLPKLNNILKPVNAAWNSYKADERSKCFPNTRTQLLEDIQKWINGDGSQAPIYFLDGVAGIGKSTVAQTIAERAAALGILGASFFFTMNEEERMTAKYFFPTIAFHLARHNTLFAQQLNSALEQDPDAAQKTLQQQVSLLLVNPLRNSFIPIEFPILMVVDALDECTDDEAHTLLTLLAHHIPRIPQLRLFIAARPEEHLRRILTKDKNHKLFHLHEIDEGIVQSDIRLYLEHSLSVEHIQEIFPDHEAPWQPSASKMLMLCGICGTLFIIASTATKFILDTKAADPERRLCRLLEGVSGADYSGSKRTDVMDKFYIRIIHNAAPDDMDEGDGWFNRYQTIIGAIIVLQNPLPCRILAQLLNLERTEIINGLRHLHSLVAPSGPDMTFRVHHKSFPDFITNTGRIERALAELSATPINLPPKFLINTRMHHHRLAAACFRVMNEHLKFNMANLTPEEWFMDKADIVTENLEPRLFGEELVYAASHWASHISAAGELDTELRDSFRMWLFTHIMAWLEVMSILDQVQRVHNMLDTALDAIKTYPHDWRERHTIHMLLSDTRRFLLQSGEVVTLTPMHIYWSALPFIPQNTLLYGTYGRRERTLSVASGIELEWDPTALVTMTGHSDWVSAVAFSPNWKTLASASYDHTIRLWDGNTGAHPITLEGHSSPVNDVAFSPDGMRFASASLDETIRLWDVTTGAPLITLEGHSDGVNSVTFSPNGSRLASGSCDKSIRLWDANAGANLIVIHGHSDYIHSVIFSPDGLRLASASKDHTVRLWDAQIGAHITTFQGHSSAVNSVAFSPDGSRLASASADHTIRLWEVTTGAHITSLDGYSDVVFSVVFSPNGLRLASGSKDRTIRLWDATTGTPIITFNGHSDSVHSVAFSPDGSRLASASWDHTVRLWDVNTDILEHHSGDARRPLDAARIGYVSSGQALHSHNTTPPNLDVLRRHSGKVTTIAYAPDGSRFVSGSEDSTLQLWHGQTGAHVTTIRGHRDRVWAAGFSPDGTRLASGSDDKTVRLWDGKTGNHLCVLDGHSKWVMAIAFSPDGSKLASGSGDKTIQLWDGNTGAHITTLSGHSDWIHDVVFSPDGLKLVSTSCDREIWVWDGHSGSHITTIKSESPMSAVAFSPAGSTFAWIQSESDTLYMRPINNNFRPISLQKHLESIASFAFLPSAPHSTSLPTIATDDVIDPLFTHTVTSDYPLRILVLGRRQNPSLSGLVYLKVPAVGEPVMVPFCWFPPHFHITAFSVDPSGSSIAVGCYDGHVLFLDISRVLLP